MRVWLDAGLTPRFTFRNGLMDARNLWARLLRKYPDQFPRLKRGGIVEHRYNAIAYGKLPQIHIHEIEIEGPIFESWPTASQRALLGNDCEQILKTSALTREQTRRLLGNFLSRAYRRPARADDIDNIMQVVDIRLEAGRSQLEAYADGLKAALCSPNFLYLEESAQPATEKPDSNPPPLSAFALAARLSYFLWSSQPDRTLLKLADDDQLQQADVLAAQVQRMLADDKSDALVDGFLGSWLKLRDLGSSPPDRNQFRDFYHYDLDSAMRRETYLFTRHLIDENLDIANFLDSDFAFVNKRLAEFYGITPPEGDAFAKVKLPRRPTRRPARPGQCVDGHGQRH